MHTESTKAQNVYNKIVLIFVSIVDEGAFFCDRGLPISST